MTRRRSRVKRRRFASYTNRIEANRPQPKLCRKSGKFRELSAQKLSLLLKSTLCCSSSLCGRMPSGISREAPVFWFDLQLVAAGFHGSEENRILALSIPAVRHDLKRAPVVDAHIDPGRFMARLGPIGAGSRQHDVGDRLSGAVARN
jgi:hypothetical protein